MGPQAVLAALDQERPIGEILVSMDHRSQHESVEKQARQLGVPVRAVAARQLEKEAPGAEAAGIVAFVRVEAFATLSNVIRLAREKGELPIVIALDGVEDSRELGDALRVAAQAGAHGVVLGGSGTQTLTPASAHRSRGASRKLVVAREANLHNALARMRHDEGVRVVGIQAGAEGVFRPIEFDQPTIVVVGDPERGLDARVRELLDDYVPLPLRDPHVGLGAAAVLALVLRKRITLESA